MEEKMVPVARFFIIVSSVLVLFFLFGAAPAQSQTSQDILKQYVADLQKNHNDYALREKIIKYVQTMKPAPAIPLEAEKFEGRAEFAFKNAKSEADFLDAASEYGKALLIAPWAGPYYFNQGFAYEKAGMPAEAKRSFEFYLLAVPNAPDARDVRKRIAGLEYAAEKAARVSSPQAIAEKKRQTEEEFMKMIDNSRYVYQSRDEDLGAGADTTIDVKGNVAISGIIMTWTRDGNPIPGFPFGVWKTIRGDGYVRGRQIVIPEQSWSGSVNDGTWFPRDPLVCAISEDGNTLTCKRTAKTGRQETNVYRRQR
jgi:tetratricopeptide (TPR) repeat protein